MHVDDLASAVEFLLQNYDEPDTINLGTGVETSIQELAAMVANAVGFDGVISNDTTKPDGTPRRMLDTTRLRAMGWKPRWDLREGIADAYRWFVSHRDFLRAI
jgi:GDP-L-fucose synthase